MTDDYPPNWKEISTAVKDVAGWRCVRCGHPNESPKPAPRIACDEQCDAFRHGGQLNDGKQRVLTVHHFDGIKSNCERWNLMALCQVCHLRIQGKIRPAQYFMFEHTEWIKPYLAGYYAKRNGG